MNFKIIHPDQSLPRTRELWVSFSPFWPCYEQIRLLVELGWVNLVKFGSGLGQQLFLGQVVSNSNMQSVFGLFNSMIHVDFYQFLNRNNIKARLILNFSSFNQESTESSIWFPVDRPLVYHYSSTVENFTSATVSLPLRSLQSQWSDQSGPCSPDLIQ